MSKQPTSIRLSEQAKQQIAELSLTTGYNQSEIVAIAIDRMYQKEFGMAKKVLDTGEMEIGGHRGRVIVTQTASGIVVNRDSLYSDETPATEFYRNGNYPVLPAEPDAPINDSGTTQAQKFLHDLGGHAANRTTRK